MKLLRVRTQVRAKARTWLGSGSTPQALLAGMPGLIDVAAKGRKQQAGADQDQDADPAQHRKHTRPAEDSARNNPSGTPANEATANADITTPMAVPRRAFGEGIADDGKHHRCPRRRRTPRPCTAPAAGT